MKLFYIIPFVLNLLLATNASSEELRFDPYEYARNASTGPRTSEAFQSGQRAAAEIGAAQTQQQLYSQQMEMQAQEHAMQMERLRMQNELLRRQLEQK